MRTAFPRAAAHAVLVAELCFAGAALGRAPVASSTPLAPLAAARDEAAEHYQSLVGLCERELWDIAVREARAFLARWPDHALAVHARYRLATALLVEAPLGQPVGQPVRQPSGADGGTDGESARREALELLRAASETPGFEFAAEAAMRLGQCELERGELAGAARAFERALASGKEYLALPATALLADTEFRRGRWPEAENRYRELLALAEAARGEERRGREARLGLAWCAFERQDHRAAAERAAAVARERATDQDGEAARCEAHYVLGEALAKLGQPREARAAFERVTGGPYLESALRGAAFAALELGDRRASVALFGTLLERFPEGQHAREAALQCGAMLLAEGQPRAALEVLNSRATAAPDAPIHCWRARALAALGEHAGDADSARGHRQAALAELDAAAAAAPGFGGDAALAAEASALRGELLLALGRTSEARAALAAAGSDAALQAAMAASVGDGELAAAAELARELAQRFPDSRYAPEAELVLAEERFAAQDWPAARGRFEALAAAAGTPAELAVRALSRSAWCLYYEGERRAAAARFGELVQAHPRHALAEEARAMRIRALSEEAEALSQAGDLAAAAQSYRALLGAGSTGGAGSIGAAGGIDGVEAARARYGLAWCLAESDPRAACELLEQAAGERGAALETRLAALELLVWTAKSARDPRRAEDAWRAFERESRGQREARQQGDAAGRIVEGLLAAAEAWKESGDLARALQLLDSELGRLERREDAGRVLLAAALLALESGEASAAEERARLAARVVPGTAEAAEACYRTAEAWAATGDWLRAGPLYEVAGAVAGWPARSDALYKCGYAALACKNWAAAQAALTALLDGAPESERTDDALFCLAEAHYQQGQFTACVTRLEQLGRRAPAGELAAKALFRLALADEQLERWRECAAAAAELAHGHPDFPGRAEADLARGRALARLGEREPARSVLGELVARDRGRLAAAARIELAQLAAAEGDHETALTEALKVPALYACEDEVGRALFLAAGWLEELGRREQALATWRELATLHPEHALAASALERLRALGSTPPGARSR